MRLKKGMPVSVYNTGPNGEYSPYYGRYIAQKHGDVLVELHPELHPGMPKYIGAKRTDVDYWKPSANISQNWDK